MSSFESYGLTSLFTETESNTQTRGQAQSNSNHSRGIKSESAMSSSNLFSTGKGADGDAITEKGADNVRRIGRTHVKRNRKTLFPGMDVKRALMKNVDVFVTSDNRMSDEEAGRFTLAIMARCGVNEEDDAVMVAFIKAMCLCMAINSSSQLVPGRSKMYVAGTEFDFFADVIYVLGEDARRYFRAYADTTRDYLEELIADFQAGPRSEDEEGIARYEQVCDMYEAVKFVAEKRGLTRAMNMIHDSAEFCSGKTAVQRMLLMQSKETIFATGAYLTNMVDNPVVARPKNSRPPGAQYGTGAGSDGMPNGY